MVLAGCGETSVIVPTGNFDTMIFRSLSGTDYLYANRVTDLRFEENAKAGGRTIYAERVAEFIVTRVWGYFGWNGIEFNRYNMITLSDIRMVHFRGGSGSAYLRLTSGTNRAARADVAWIHNCIFSTDQARQSLGMRGVDIGGFVHTVNLTKIGIGWAGAEALAIHNEVNSSDIPSFITAYDLEIEYPRLECIRIASGTRLSFSSSMLHGSAIRDNIYVGTGCSNADFTGGSSTGAHQSGIAIAGSSASVASMRFDTNCQLPNGDYPGILIGGTSRGVSITGCRSGHPATASSQRYGCQVDTGADGLCIIGNVFTNNRLGGLITGAGPASPTKIYGPNAG